MLHKKIRQLRRIPLIKIYGLLGGLDIKALRARMRLLVFDLQSITIILF